MLRIALTGGIATGKSYVLEHYRRHGIPTLDADQLAHGVMASGTEATAAIAAAFGPEVLAPDGSVDRRHLGAIVFADEAARRRLEAIVHPAVYRAVTAALLAIEVTERPRCAVVAIPLLYETGRDRDYQAVIATVCAPDVQRARLRARGLTDEEASARLAAQLPASEKAARANAVIRTDGSFADTERQADEALARVTLPLR